MTRCGCPQYIQSPYKPERTAHSQDSPRDSHSSQPIQPRWARTVVGQRLCASTDISRRPCSDLCWRCLIRRTSTTPRPERLCIYGTLEACPCSLGRALVSLCASVAAFWPRYPRQADNTRIETVSRLSWYLGLFLLRLLLQVHLLLELHHPTSLSPPRLLQAMSELHKVCQASGTRTLPGSCLKGSILLFYLARQFCLDQQLDICRDASKGDTDLDTGMGNQGDVQTKCFRTVMSPELWPSGRGLIRFHGLRGGAERDSALVRTAVILFIIITGTLLVWAAIKDHVQLGAFSMGDMRWRVRRHESGNSWCCANPLVAAFPELVFKVKLKNTVYIYADVKREIHSPVVW
jgi:hypothetical protein